MINPNPKAALISPNCFARRSGGVTSVIYANAVEIFDVVIPEISRPINSQPTVGASAIKI